MARANLNIDSGLSSAFLAAQEESSPVRALRISIINEDIVLNSTIDREGSNQRDFNSIVGLLSEREAALILFCLTDGVATGKGRSWLFLAWVPDGCKVRDKMLYSSSREDLKRALGVGYFTEEYSANVITDVSWESYLAFTIKSDKESVMTDTERLIIEENALTQKESTRAKSAAMGVLPFTLREGVQEEFQKFKVNSVNWIELSIVDESIQLEASKTVDRHDSLQKHIKNDSARFFILKLPNHLGELVSIFVFSCPEDTPIRMKMTMSSSKATVIAAIVEEGVSIDRNLEIRGAEEITDLLIAELDPPVADGASSSAAAVLAHAKPQRPGRGRAKVSKFQADA